MLGAGFACNVLGFFPLDSGADTSGFFFDRSRILYLCLHLVCLCVGAAMRDGKVRLGILSLQLYPRDRYEARNRLCEGVHLLISNTKPKDVFTPLIMCSNRTTQTSTCTSSHNSSAHLRTKRDSPPPSIAKDPSGTSHIHDRNGVPRHSSASYQDFQNQHLDALDFVPSPIVRLAPRIPLPSSLTTRCLRNYRPPPSVCRSISETTVVEVVRERSDL